MHPFRILAPAALLLMAGCGEVSPGPTREEGKGIPPLPSEAPTTTRAANNPAQSLSLSSGSALNVEGTPFARAAACFTAVTALETALESMPALAGKAERAALQQAKTLYEQRALKAAETEGLGAGETRTALDERLQQGLDNPAPEVQRATMCLRELAGR